MTHSPLARLVALLFALSGALAVPVSAVVHGVAHHHEATGHHSPDVHSVASGLASQADAMAHIVQAVEGHDDPAGNHPHERVVAELTVRGVLPLMAVVAAGGRLPDASEVLMPTVRPEVTAEHRENLVHDAPPRLRAPPGFPA